MIDGRIMNNEKEMEYGKDFVITQSKFPRGGHRNPKIKKKWGRPKKGIVGSEECE